MKKAGTTNKCASVMGHFDGHDDATVATCDPPHLLSSSSSMSMYTTINIILSQVIHPCTCLVQIVLEHQQNDNTGNACHMLVDGTDFPIPPKGSANIMGNAFTHPTNTRSSVVSDLVDSNSNFNDRYIAIFLVMFLPTNFLDPWINPFSPAKTPR